MLVIDKPTGNTSQLAAQRQADQEKLTALINEYGDKLPTKADGIVLGKDGIWIQTGTDPSIRDNWSYIRLTTFDPDEMRISGDGVTNSVYRRYTDNGSNQVSISDADLLLNQGVRLRDRSSNFFDSMMDVATGGVYSGLTTGNWNNAGTFASSIATAGVSDWLNAFGKSGWGDTLARGADIGGLNDKAITDSGELIPTGIRPYMPMILSIIGGILGGPGGAAAGQALGTKLAGANNNQAFNAGIQSLPASAAGSIAGGIVGGATSGLGSATSTIASSAAQGAASGATNAAVHGGDAGQGALQGLYSGLISGGARALSSGVDANFETPYDTSYFPTYGQIAGNTLSALSNLALGRDPSMVAVDWGAGLASNAGNTILQDILGTNLKFGSLYNTARPFIKGALTQQPISSQNAIISMIQNNLTPQTVMNNRKAATRPTTINTKTTPMTSTSKNAPSYASNFNNLNSLPQVGMQNTLLKQLLGQGV